ncbi:MULTISPECIES: LysR family transcriptional regulator [Acinetobacter]|uniref:LysR family transcriptional regulator n=1 Tax=Acinetobacter TaxID=469 RepID=UPI00019AE2C8|nr:MULTISPECIES: LysR family transcriptional regulator [Acinetobacter]EEH67455.1 als operon regulatory protein AlsR [Acinetobacter sp. ATCC 27244]NAS08977.1 LysR family transcriptional regulator [Acinetobacter haemolyticus]SUU21395.1 Putative transcriptional regulator [Acinetobacter haemolyticus]
MLVSKTLFNKNLPTIKQLQCFLAVVEELNFRKAAERMNMTQPPLTRQIQCLEDLMGQDLFIRNTHKVHLTSAGQRLVQKVESIILQLESLDEELLQNEFNVKLGYTRTINFENIPQLFKKIKEVDFEDDILNQNFTSNQLLNNLIKNKLDIALIGEKIILDQCEIKYEWLYKEPLLVALPAQHPASINEKISLQDISDLPLFWFSRNANPAFYDKCEKYFQSLPFELKKIKEPDDSLVMLARISKGRGFALLPKSLCSFFQEGLAYRSLSHEDAMALNIDVYVAIRNNENKKNVLDAYQSLTRV